MRTRCCTRLVGTLAVLAGLCATATEAQTLYRIVGPDGRVTYTDRPPAGATGAVVGAAGAPRAAASGVAGEPPGSGAQALAMAGWPAPLRTAAARFPVTFFAAEACPPCDEARRLLQRRGIPYTEKRVRTEEDARRLEQLTGGRLVPAATIGRQALSGFQEQDWQGWLDSAGYPRTRVLPATWQPAAATPLAGPMTMPAAPATAAAAIPGAAGASSPAPRTVLPLPAEPGPGPAGIRF